MKIPKYYKRIIKAVHEWENFYKSGEMSFPEETQKLRTAIASAKKPKEKREIMVQAIALCDVAIQQTLGYSLYDVQIFGAVVLCENRIAEMKTGEGKTIVAVAASFFMSLDGGGVHIVTVNDYLARTQSTEMKLVFDLLGVSVGCVLSKHGDDERRAEYHKDIVYVTNKELGFDYLRDNLKRRNEDGVLRPLHTVIIDEVDSILIDEARTPLIISSSISIDQSLCKKANEFVLTLKQAAGDGINTPFQDLKSEMMLEFHDIDGDYIVDRTYRTVALTAVGIEKAEEFFHVNNLSDEDNLPIIESIRESLVAHTLMEKDKDYVVKDGKIMIVDEFTGRIMGERRYSDGLHQAIEAKENVKILEDNAIAATITLQNFFKLYDNMSGMTGTAKTSAKEFKQVYDKDVIAIPTNMPVIRKDNPDKYFATKEDCYSQIIEDIISIHETGQPVLVGTQTVSDSELISSRLKAKGIKHNLLNAKNDALEANIVAQAGKSNSVTIATNMAGRGTDILLGGNAEPIAKHAAIEKVDPLSPTFKEDYFAEYERVKAIETPKCKEDHELVVSLGGLYVIGVGRNTSRRIDNQLIGRAGRQGDIGESCYYISYDDELIRLYVNKKRKFGDKFARGGRFSRALVASAQRKIQNMSFDSRKNTFQMDSATVSPRDTIYELRKDIIGSDDMNAYIDKVFFDIAEVILKRFDSSRRFSDNGKALILDFLDSEYHLDTEPLNSLRFEEFVPAMRAAIKDKFEKRITAVKENNDDFEEQTFLKYLFLQKIDINWSKFLSDNIQLRASASLNTLGALTAIQSYKIETAALYDQMIDDIKLDIVKYLVNMSSEKNVPEYAMLKNIVY